MNPRHQITETVIDTANADAELDLHDESTPSSPSSDLSFSSTDDSLSDSWVTPTITKKSPTTDKNKNLFLGAHVIPDHFSLENAAKKIQEKQNGRSCRDNRYFFAQPKPTAPNTILEILKQANTSSHHQTSKSYKNR